MPESRLGGDDDAFVALVLRYLDGATSPDEDALLAAELQENDARGEIFVSLSRQRGQLRELLSPKRAARPIPWKWLLGAAAALLAGLVGYLLLSREGPAPIAVLERAEGAVSRSDGSSISVGGALFAGQGIGTNGKGRAVILYPDGSRVELAAQTQVSGLDVSGGKTLFVDRGVVSADVTKQPAGHPMLLRGSQAEAKVLGTKFLLTVKPGSTRLDVQKGRVRLTRLSDR